MHQVSCLLLPGQTQLFRSLSCSSLQSPNPPNLERVLLASLQWAHERPGQLSRTAATSNLQYHPVTRHSLLRGSVQPVSVKPSEGFSGCWEAPTPLDNCRVSFRVLKSFRVIPRDPFSSLRGEPWFCFLIPPIPYFISFHACIREVFSLQDSAF